MQLQNEIQPVSEKASIAEQIAFFSVCVVMGWGIAIIFVVGLWTVIKALLKVIG